MKGQWFGEFTGTNSGPATINIEMIDHRYRSHAILLDNDTNQPSFSVDIELTFDETSSQFKGNCTNLTIFTKPLFSEISVDEYRAIYPSVPIPSTINVEGTKSNNSISGTWQSDVQTQGTFKLFNYTAPSNSTINVTLISWDEFKKEMFDLTNKANYIFRGQSGSWPLRTSFHRSGRCNIRRYVNEDIPNLCRHLTGLEHNFNLNDPIQYGALLYLAQHHGFPTPLLDWSESPFIAAYFAFSTVETDTHIRIFKFDIENWKKNTPQVPNLISPFPTVTYRKLYPIANNRALQQQAVSTLSHFDDIEKYIEHQEQLNKKSYLKVYELDANAKTDVMNDLHYMGINAASIYPGLEGTCKMLRERFFIQ